MSVSIQAVPDHIGALVTYWRTLDDLVAVAGTTDGTPNIAGKIPASIQPKSRFLVPEKNGNAGAELYVPLYRPRVNVKCYGSNEYEAMKLWRYVHPTIVPHDRRSYTIQANDCLITGCVFEAGPNELVDPDGDWPFVLATYHFEVLMVPYST